MTSAETDDEVWHPAKFSKRCLAEIAELLRPHYPDGGQMLDPFAGEGGIHALAEHGWATVGVEKVGRWAAKHPHTVHGDSTQLCPGLFAPETFDVVATSPTWGNGMNQRNPNPNAGVGRRYSYPDAAGEPMEATNTGGARFTKTDKGTYRQLHLTIWPQVVRVIRPDGLLVLNCRDSTNGDDGFRDVTGWHIEVLQSYGMRLGTMSGVTAKGLGFGQRRRWVGDAELLVVMRKTEPRFVR